MMPARIPAALYFLIKRLMPLTCVDIVLLNERSEVLLVRRTNEPGKGEWWFPGGRVLWGESRKEAAIRKMKEECGIESKNLISQDELGTFEIIFKYEITQKVYSHAVSTVFVMKLRDVLEVKLDKQSSSWRWISLKIRDTVSLNPLVNDILDRVEKYGG